MRTLLLSLLLAGSAPAPSHPAPSYPSSPQGLLKPQGPLKRGMRNCPSALVGATTRVIHTKDGATLKITATDPVVQRQIIQLAIVHTHLGRPNPAEPAHSGMHGAPGNIGYCPIIHIGTRVTARRRSDGAVIHMHALHREDVPHLQLAIADRMAQLPRDTRDK